MRRGIAVVALVAAPLFADDVYLKGGGRVTGEIVERSDESVTVNIGSGTISVRKASIVRIEASVSPSQEYRQRAAAIPAGDAEAWRELARWATGNALATQAGQAWSRVVEMCRTTPRPTARSAGSGSTVGGSPRRRATAPAASSSSRASG